MLVVRPLRATTSRLKLNDKRASVWVCTLRQAFIVIGISDSEHKSANLRTPWKTTWPTTWSYNPTLKAFNRKSKRSYNLWKTKAISESDPLVVFCCSLKQVYEKTCQRVCVCVCSTGMLLASLSPGIVDTRWRLQQTSMRQQVLVDPLTKCLRLYVTSIVAAQIYGRLVYCVHLMRLAARHLS
eukprot:1058647-Amphidinium_carterae.2